MTYLFPVHGSSLPTFIDCEGRWAAANLPSLKQKVTGGKEFVGSVFGTTAHKAIARGLQHKQEYGTVPAPENYIELAYREFDEAFKKGVQTDNTTKTTRQAHIQLDMVIRESWFSYLSRAKPLRIEHKQIYPIENTIIQVVMTPDVVTLDGFIDDHKFPRTIGDYKAQGGTYIIGAELRDNDKKKGFRLQVIKRVGESSAPAELLEIVYDRSQCLDAAKPALKRLNYVLIEWVNTKNTKIFRMNPNSKFCGNTTCGFWGTSHCNQWTDIKGELKR